MYMAPDVEKNWNEYLLNKYKKAIYKKSNKI